ncbi:MICOS complex subunit MIC25 isoform X2 [Erinaceus europaeus]|uniref:MICOS complex subunit MIC25 isoform X2 n=1 Tax=Erinaceus europaeus TaxID=9365 RepID=A0ABM3WI58_ERIEU|nr:MICOS complex subunit MIC25 isoform X2 [Erinaceus europaeus]
MGSSESSEGRRVSFGVDEEERLSENVVDRMKDPCQPSRAGQPLPPPVPPLSTPGTCEGPEKGSSPPRSEASGTEDLLKRYKQEQATLQDELLQVAQREREAARKPPQSGEGSRGPEQRKSDQLARELESREAELRRRETFYQEQLGRIEKKSAEMYRLSSQQFHEAASKAECKIKPRRVEPVCGRLQAQLLHCYRAHAQEVLLCSDLVKAYQHCVSAAHKG